MSRLQHLLRDCTDVQTAVNAPTVETQTTQPPRNEVESQAAPLSTSEEPS